MKPIKRIVATVGKYTNQYGEEKNRYLNIGTLLQRDDGSQCIKIESLPLEWNGWANFYDIEDKRQSTQHEEQKQNGYQRQDLDDEIPY